MGRELHVHSHLSRLERWRHGIEIAALIIAAAWGFYVFVYQERIKPASEEIRIQPMAELRHTLLASGKEYVEVRLTIKNISAVDAYLDGMVVNVYGLRFADRRTDRVETPLAGVTELNRSLEISRPALLYSFYDTWAPFGAPASKVNAIRAGEEFHEIIPFGIAERSFDFAKVTFTTCIARSEKPWHVFRLEQPDRSYGFGGLPPHASGIICGGQRRGEFFPL